MDWKDFLVKYERKKIGILILIAIKIFKIGKEDLFKKKKGMKATVPKDDDPISHELACT